MTVQSHDDAAPMPDGTLPSSSPATKRALTSFRDLLRQTFGRSRRSSVPYEWFSETEIGSLDATGDTHDPARVDDNTWRDLEVPALLERLGGRASILGRQHLYRRLRRGGRVADEVRAGLAPEQSAQTLQVLGQTQAIRHELRCQDIDTVPALFLGQLPQVPSFVRHMWMAPDNGVRSCKVPGLA